MRRIPWSLVSPSLVLLQLTIAYALVPWTCRQGTDLPIHAVMAVTFALVAFATWAAWRELRALRADDAAQPLLAARRPTFTASLDVLVSLIALLVVAAQWIAVFVLGSCQ
jgi:hypothetical protein